jgi:hypothetical protein
MELLTDLQCRRNCNELRHQLTRVLALKDKKNISQIPKIIKNTERMTTALTIRGDGTFNIIIGVDILLHWTKNFEN